MEEFQLSKFTDEGAKLLADVTAEFKRLGLDTSTLPKVFPDDSGKIKLVFAGQYGAGKSSIIKMLTGEDVEVGAGITTQNFSSYDWNGLEIVDTPGIHTELRPDHDEITYEQINHAALLIFVITNEGFSQRMGDHFRKLAIEQKRADNMVLVVNKIDRTALGNVPEQQKIIADDLSRVTKPYRPDDLFVSFVDTASYFKALEETDERRKKRRLDKSGHDIFVENLNRFVEAKGILQKINLPLNTIAAAIRAVSAESSAEQKEDFSAYADTIRKKKQILLDEQKFCMDEINSLISNLKNKIERYGVDVADEIVDDLTSGNEKDADRKMNDAQKDIEKIAAEYAEKVDACTKYFISHTETNIRNYESSSFVQKVNANYFKSFSAVQSGGLGGGAVAIGAGGIAAGAIIAQQGAQFASQFVLTTVTPLGEFVGSVVEIGVTTAISQDAGIFSGFIASQAGGFIKGLPFFQAEQTLTSKLASFFAGNARVIGAAVGAIATVFSLWSTYRDGKKAEERERALRQARAEIISNFESIASNIGEKISSSVNQWMEVNINPIAADFDKQIKAVESQVSGAQVKSEKLTEMLKRTENLITEIQNSK
ncbi:MAG: 50S ribosome-binding GTPase [Selenomonadaceae bacterium]|nr:50S ribosome-binding GTPase [Selenomonadaceae bacterium]